MIKILSNVSSFSKGKIEIGTPLKIGVCLEDNYFENELTVKENLYFYAKIKGVDISNEQELLEQFELSDFSNKEYYKISGGNRKKLSIACAFLGNNDFIILDELTMGIDVVTKK